MKRRLRVSEIEAAKFLASSCSLPPEEKRPRTEEEEDEVATQQRYAEAHPVWPHLDMQWDPSLVEKLFHTPQDPKGLWRLRALVLSGTTCAKALNLSPYQGSDAISFWLELKGLRRREPFTDDAIQRMQRGTRLEPHVRNAYAEIMHVAVVEKGITIDHRRLPWLGHSADGYVQEEEAEDGTVKPIQNVFDGVAIIEIKCPSKPYREKPVPLTYMIQMQVGCYVHRKPYCDFVVYHTQHQIVIRRVFFSDDYWTVLKGGLLYFMQCMKQDVLPRPAFLPRRDMLPAVRTELLYEGPLNLDHIETRYRNVPGIL